MMLRRYISLTIIILTFIVLALFNFVAQTQAQGSTPTPDPRELIIEEIRTYANRHVRNNIPLQTQTVVEIFRDNSAGLTSSEIAQIYEEEYIRLHNANEPTLWEQFRPNTGWVVAAILFVLIIFRDILKKWITNLFEIIEDWVYTKLSGSRFLRRAALRKYQRALRKKYHQLYIPFRPNRPLAMAEIYVPLKVIGTSDINQFDTYQAITRDKRLMVIGPPGSGKSMLLKSLVLAYAENKMVDLPDRPIPILLELNRLNESALTIESHLEEELARNDFPNAKRFVSHSLTGGRIMVLFDGLDEVNSSERRRVVRWIKNFLDKFKECRIVITCRIAVYRNEFADVVDRTLEIVEFNDQQIRSFLSTWETDMPPDKSIEQLMGTLRDRPRIMSLARNPLLLTIIAYLYTDTPYVLPHSRAEFYEQSTDILLRQWHQEHNYFESRDKQAVLRHLALYNQDSAAQRQQDRRSIEYQTVLAQIHTMLPGLNLKPEQDRAILDEIVERSGLLLAIDGGERYQFAHLTLQEFFAAAELIDDTRGLLSRFKADPDTWRETVKLWCGLASDSTSFISDIYQTDQITGFECLADAQKVEPSLVEEIVTHFKTKLGTSPAITLAFAAVASDLRPRGKEVFEFLENTLSTFNSNENNGDEKEIKNTLSSSESDDKKVKNALLKRCEAAITGLSLTNLPRAAQVLGTHYSKDLQIRPALIRMGDLAVSVLINLLVRGRNIDVLDVLDDLQTIGSPQVAMSLVPFLWSEDETFAQEVSWRLATLLPKPDVENALRDYHQLNQTRKNAEIVDWIWKPFNEPVSSALLIITGRVAYLIGKINEPPKLKENTFVDPRLIIPLVSIPTAASSSSQKILRDLLDPDMTKKLETKLRLGRAPTRDHWINLFRPLGYDLMASWHYRTILVLTVLNSLLWLTSIVISIQNSSTLPSWDNIHILPSMINLLAIWFVYLRSRRNDTSDKLNLVWLGMIMLVPIIPAVLSWYISLFVFSVLVGHLSRIKYDKEFHDPQLYELNKFIGICGTLLGVFLLIWITYLLLNVFTTPLKIFLPWPYGIVIWFVLLVINIILMTLGLYRDYNAGNPFFGILDTPTTEFHSHLIHLYNQRLG